MKKLRAGVVGVGFIGTVHVEQLRRLGNVEVAAITDSLDADGKAARLFVPKGYEDYKEMIDVEKLDCIHICTPNNTHYEIAMYAMERGVHVICEKPMTVTLEEARILKETASEKHLINAMNFNCRFYPMAFQMREMVKSGQAGDIYTVHGGYLQDWLYYDTDYSWRLEPEASGASRAFADIGSHWIDLVEFVTGISVTEVFADFAIFHKTRKKPLNHAHTYSSMALLPETYDEVPIHTEDHANVLFHLENGAHACCNISQVYAGRKNRMMVSIGGSRCSMEWDSEKSNALWVGNRSALNGELVKDPSILAPETGSIISYPGGHVEGFADTFKQNFKQIYARIADPQSKNGDYADFNAGYREMVLCDRIIHSAREKRWISVE